MSLLRLPPETLKQILDFVGSSFFHEDIGRLTVSKQWFDFARPACFKCVTLVQETLRILISSEDMSRLSPLTDSLETLDLNLRGYQACNSTLYPQADAQEANASETATPNEPLRDNPVKTWMKVLNNDLAQLAIIGRQSRKLRILRIRAWSSPPPEILDNPEDYISLPTMRALLSMENLSVLVLDLSVGLLISSGEQEDGGHICPAIGALLRTLTTLHLRMRSICPDVLKPNDPNDDLRLSAVVVNLSLTTDLPGVTSAAHSKRCDPPGGGLLQLKADMQEQAEALAARMASPKIMRILTHSLPQFETQSLDVLTGKIMILDDDMAWDEDGKTVEDSEPESDLLDDDFSTFLDD
ncbi:hypothetical protein QQX98_007185 [Neonectria punicea]|uniref:F-box domain-containing protein n=1 Tax=Neonectria punicea TaxID=979145 RepID=A0ABR1GYL1_9HYPO